MPAQKKATSEVCVCLFKSGATVWWQAGFVYGCHLGEGGRHFKRVPRQGNITSGTMNSRDTRRNNIFKKAGNALLTAVVVGIYSHFTCQMTTGALRVIRCLYTRHREAIKKAEGKDVKAQWLGEMQRNVEAWQHIYSWKKCYFHNLFIGSVIESGSSVILKQRFAKDENASTNTTYTFRQATDDLLNI